MNLTHRETDQVFRIMADLSGEHSCCDTRRSLGQRLLDLLDADYFASYVWNGANQAFGERVHINMSDDNLARYDAHYQFCDPITPTLRRRRRATPVSAVMGHRRLEQTEFYNDFLQRDGLCYGLNFFAYDRGRNIGDLRVWRRQGKEDFSPRDAAIVDAIGPAFTNALRRAQAGGATATRRFVDERQRWGLSAREAEVADMAACGLSDQDISERLCLTRSTIRTHLARVFDKTGVRRRSALPRLLGS